MARFQGARMNFWLVCATGFRALNSGMTPQCFVEPSFRVYLKGRDCFTSPLSLLPMQLSPVCDAIRRKVYRTLLRLAPPAQDGEWALKSNPGDALLSDDSSLCNQG